MAMGQTGERRPRHEITNPHLLEALEKVEVLEGTLNSFRAEMDMKMRILEQILATRNGNRQFCSVPCHFNVTYIIRNA